MIELRASEREAVAAIALAGLGAWLLTRLALRLDPPLAALLTVGSVAALVAARRRARGREPRLVLTDDALAVRSDGDAATARIVRWSEVSRVERTCARVASPRGPVALELVRVVLEPPAPPVLAADLAALGGAAVVLEPDGAPVLDIEDPDVLFAVAAARCARDDSPPPSSPLARETAPRRRARGRSALADSPARGAGWLLAGLLAVRAAEALWDAPAGLARAALYGAGPVALAAGLAAAIAVWRPAPRQTRAARAAISATFAGLGCGVAMWLTARALGPPACQPGGAWALLAGFATALPARALPGGSLASVLGPLVASARPRARALACAGAYVACAVLLARGMTVAPLAVAAAAVALVEAAHAHERAANARAAATDLANPRRAALHRGSAAALTAWIAALVLTAWALARLTHAPDAAVAEVARIAFR